MLMGIPGLRINRMKFLGSMCWRIFLRANRKAWLRDLRLGTVGCAICVRKRLVLVQKGPNATSASA